jgi:hypothetical protein
MQKTMTNIQQQDARLIEMDAAIVAAIRLHVPEFEAAYLDDNLPRWFQRLLDHCTACAEHVADCTDAAFIETLSALLGQALGRHQPIADYSVPGTSRTRSARQSVNALEELDRGRIVVLAGWVFR